MNDNVDDGDKSKALLNESGGGEAVSIGLENSSDQNAGDDGPYSEVFWANSVLVTLRQTHPRVPQLTTELQCQYKFERGSLYVRTLRYKMTTRNGNWNRANIDLYLKTLTSAVEYSPDALLQDGAWHEYSRIINSPWGPVAGGGLKNRIYIRVDYDGTNNDVGPHEGFGPEVYPAAQPFIDGPGPNTIIGASFLVSGSNSLVGGTIHVFFKYGNVSVAVGVGPGDISGRWSANCTLPSGLTEKGILIAVQKIGDQTSVLSNSVDVYPQRGPIIIYPPKNAVLRQGDPLKLRGTGTYRWDLDVMTPGGGVLHASAKVKDDMTWEADFNLANYPSGGKVEMTAGHRNMNDWSGLHSFLLLGSPIISVPQPLQVIDPNGPISGTGESGANVEVFVDLSLAVRIGQAVVESDGSWKIVSFENEMSPGPFSIVARQTLSGVQGKFGAPRGFRVRPAKITGVAVEFIDNSIKFSGSAHAGATVVITAPGYAVTPPGEVVATGGQWATTATDWPYGTYNLQIVQKVGDGASGWIESLPYDFEIIKVLPDVSEVTSTPDYQPTVTGKGSHGATVQLLNPGGTDAGFPDAVVTNGQWSSTALTQWGPTRNYPLNIRQSRDGQHSPNWVAHYINIPPLAPGLDDPLEDELSPRLSGTCWPGAVVSLQYSDEDNVVHKPTVSNDKWTFRRDKPFATGVEHTVTVTQFAAEQPSLPASATFTVRRPMSRPRITYPDPTSKVGRDVTVKGENGMQGAVMQLRDAQFQSPLGPEKTLDANGAWSIDLAGLEFRRYTIDAQQILDERPSERSEHCYFDVVLLPPQICQPTENGKLSRTAKIAGSGMANGRVEVFLEGVSEPLLSDILVNDKGDWEGEVTLPVGHTIIRARQTFVDGNDQRQESDLGEARQYDVVPAAPLIETPTEDDPVGRRTVVSGFGVPGDTVTVTVTLADATHSLQSSAIVQEDRTWSVTQDFSSLAGGPYVLEAVASLEEFASVEALRPIMLGTFLPTLDAPAAGRWVSHPLQFAGRGRKGVGTVVSWYNPDVQWTGPLPIAGETWHGEATQPLPESGNWFRFRQSITDEEDGETMSDWVESARFEVERTHPPVEGS